MGDERLIVALDLPNPHAGLKIVSTLGEYVSFYKIGLGMLTTGGLGLANELKSEYGKKIFLDLKLFDIGQTVENAVRGIANFELDFLTVHGDPQVVKAAKEGASGKKLKILAVTILTSLNRSDLDTNLIKPGDINSIVAERTEKAFEAGADGVITSPNDIISIKQMLKEHKKLVITPGIRPKTADLGDQKRTSTPQMAIRNGADYIVVGRPIHQASDPKTAVKAIIKEMQNV